MDSKGLIYTVGRRLEGAQEIACVCVCVTPLNSPAQPPLSEPSHRFRVSNVTTMLAVGERVVVCFVSWNSIV